jgi:hypothetical protein
MNRTLRRVARPFPQIGRLATAPSFWWCGIKRDRAVQISSFLLSDKRSKKTATRQPLNKG